MSATRFDVTGVGNAIVDVFAQVDYQFLTTNKIEKAAMNLIDEDRAEILYNLMPSGREISGGSAANTLAGVASLGGRGAYIGKVADDQLGKIFAHDMRAIGVDYQTAALRGGPATARSLIMITPDAQRSMNTFLGASVMFDEIDVDVERIQAATVTYLEGYLFDREEAKAAFVKASEAAKAAGRKVSLTLSDTFCVDRHRTSFLQLVKNHIDLLFANEAELMALYETDDFDTALEKVRADTQVAAVTRSEKGAVVVSKEETVVTPAAPVSAVLDTTGAGDLFASGFLLGYARGASWDICARLGAVAAAEIISHVGARPEQSLEKIAHLAGLEWPDHA